MIKLSNITKVFQQGNRTIQALNNVSLHVPAGQIYGVIGASGRVKARSSAVLTCLSAQPREALRWAARNLPLSQKKN